MCPPLWSSAGSGVNWVPAGPGMLDSLHLQLCSCPALTLRTSWSTLSSHCNSFVWHVGCTSESSEDLDSKAGEVGVLGRQGLCAAQHPSWQAQAGLFLLWDVLQQLKASAFPSFPWTLISKLTTLVWLWGLSTCSSAPTYVLEAWGPVGVCVCVQGYAHVCIYIYIVYMACVCRALYACAVCIQQCKLVCICACVHGIFCVQHTLDACVCECRYVPRCRGVHICKATSVTVVSSLQAGMCPDTGLCT